MTDKPPTFDPTNLEWMRTSTNPYQVSWAAEIDRLASALAASEAARVAAEERNTINAKLDERIVELLRDLATTKQAEATAWREYALVAKEAFGQREARVAAERERDAAERRGIERAAQYHDEREKLFADEADKRLDLDKFEFVVAAQSEKAHARNIRALLPAEPKEPAHD